MFDEKFRVIQQLASSITTEVQSRYIQHGKYVIPNSTFYLRFLARIIFHKDCNTSFNNRLKDCFHLKFKRLPATLSDYREYLLLDVPSFHEFIEEIYWMKEIDNALLEDKLIVEDYSNRSKITPQFTNKTFEHVMTGELNNSVIEGISLPVISGGLHNGESFDNFIKIRRTNDPNFEKTEAVYIKNFADLVLSESDHNVNNFSSSIEVRKKINSEVFMERTTLSNGVEIVKIPRRLLNSRQWKQMSQSSEGPIKTLFPKHLNYEDIKKIVKQIVANPILIIKQGDWGKRFVGRAKILSDNKITEIWASCLLKDDNNEVVTTFPLSSQPKEIYPRAIYLKYILSEDLSKYNISSKEVLRKIIPSSMTREMLPPFGLVDLFNGNVPKNFLGIKVFWNKPVGSSVELLFSGDVQNPAINVNGIMRSLDHPSFRAPRLFLLMLISTDRDLIYKISDDQNFVDEMLEEIDYRTNNVLSLYVAKPLEVLNIYDNLYHTTYSYSGAEKLLNNFVVYHNEQLFLKSRYDASMILRIFTEFSLINVKRSPKIAKKFMNAIKRDDLISLYPLEICKSILLFINSLLENGRIKLEFRYHLDKRKIIKILNALCKSLLKYIKNGYLLVVSPKDIEQFKDIIPKTLDILYLSLMECYTNDKEVGGNLGETIEQIKDYLRESIQFRDYSDALVKFSDSLNKEINEWYKDTLYSNDINYEIDFANTAQIRTWGTNW